MDVGHRPEERRREERGAVREDVHADVKRPRAHLEERLPADQPHNGERHGEDD